MVVRSAAYIVVHSGPSWAEHKLELLYTFAYMLVLAPTTQVTTTSASVTAATPAMVGSGAESTFAPPPSRGLDAEDADGWITRFGKYCAYRGFSDHERLNLMAVLLRDEASDWYDSLKDDIKRGWSTLKEAFEQCFQNTELTCVRQTICGNEWLGKCKCI